MSVAAAEDDAAEAAEVAGANRYRAPALEKGLDILELLAVEVRPLTLSGIVNRLGRSHGELFRMVQVLQARGYIEQDLANEGYRLTDQLFQLAIQRPQMSNLIETALPVMRQLAADIAQSCHLAVQTRGELIVVARMESAEKLGFSVRVGYRQPLALTASGAVIYAFQPDDVRARWNADIRAASGPEAFESFLRDADKTRARGYEQRASSFVSGVIDISAPVMRGGAAAGALTVPFLKTLHPQISPAAACRRVRDAAEEVSSQLLGSDSRL